MSCQHIYEGWRRIHVCISGLVVEYIVAIDVTRAQFPADAHDSQGRPGQARAYHMQTLSYEATNCQPYPRNNATEAMPYTLHTVVVAADSSQQPAARCLVEIGLGRPINTSIEVGAWITSASVV